MYDAEHFVKQCKYDLIIEEVHIKKVRYVEKVGTCTEIPRQKFLVTVKGY
jgi:hypothetical protein